MKLHTLQYYAAVSLPISIRHSAAGTATGSLTVVSFEAGTQD